MADRDLVMPEPLILPAPAVDYRQKVPGLRSAARTQGSRGRPVGVAAILVLIALTAGLLGAGLTYQLRGGATGEPASSADGVKAST